MSSYNQCLFFVPYKFVCKLNSNCRGKKVFKINYLWICFYMLYLTLNTIQGHTSYSEAYAGYFATRPTKFEE